ncbi:magnesium transporter [Thermus thermamylovorans]|uniref:Magnesium transporter MgtE n=1 Tax=Thermus thermamylovorans TaxID=2509362 RepID=A0A4Q9B525_9DEIN|nr:magnesium transporter [Thermus thermamylovorans]TBH20687.1 magnesium transporter [Thermus thermamylovorans]
MNLKETLERKELNRVKIALASMGVEEVVALLQDLEPKERAVAFRLLDKEKALRVFEALDRYEQTELVRALDDPEILNLLAEMDPEEQAWLLGELPAKVVKRILQELPQEARERVSYVLGFPEGSAGRLMDPAYLALPEETRAEEALERVRASELDPEDLEVVFVLGPGRAYRGYVPLSRLVKAPPGRPLGELAEGGEVFVSAYAGEEEAARLFLDRGLNLLPVVDREGRLLGVIHAGRVFALLQEQEARRVVRYGGTVGLPPKGEDIDLVHDPLGRIFLGRFVWLALLVVFGMFASTFVAAQEEILEAAIILAAFIAPIIDMGGNTGSQAATLAIRALALGQVRPRLRDFLLLLRRDIPVALALGVAVALLKVVLSLFVKDVFGEVLLVVGLAMLSVTVLGSLLGLSLPFLAKRLGRDPATLSAPVITSVMDLLGVMVYFGLAWVFLRHLLEG